jgi:hypothetical protein
MYRYPLAAVYISDYQYSVIDLNAALQLSQYNWSTIRYSILSIYHYIQLYNIP